MSIFFQYLQERFPPFPALLYGLGYAGLVVGITQGSHLWQTQPQQMGLLFLIVTGIFICFLFRQRAVDEFRDFKHDAKYFPSRPLHRGLVNSQQIVTWGIIALACEFFLTSLIAPLIWYLPVFIYSILMAKDFLIKSWLDRHFTTHFFIHEVFFIILGWYFVINLSLHQNPVSVLVNIFVLVVAPMSIELVRKFKPRKDAKGVIVKDSYSAVWGKNHTILFLISLTMITAIGLSWLHTNEVFLIVASIISILMWLSKKQNKTVMVLGAVQYILLALIANLV